MPEVPIDISRGAFKSMDPFEIGNTGYAAVLENALINDVGTNIKRPGLSTFALLGAFKVQGLKEFGSYLVAVTSDRKIWGISSAAVATSIEDAAFGGTNRPVFAEDGTYLAMAGGGAPKRWDGDIAAATENMPGSPPNCNFISYMDNYWFAPKINTQECYWAGPTAADRESWGASDAFEAEYLPDDINAQAVLLKELYLFGQDSAETWQNVGDTSVPLAKAYQVDRGLGAPYSVLHADNSLWWLSEGKNGDKQFFTLQGRVPVAISTPTIDTTLRGFTTVSDCWGAVVDIPPHYLLIWTFPTEERTFVFDYRLKYWAEWNRWYQGSATRFRAHAHTYVKAWRKHFIGDPNRGVIYELSPSNYTDSGDSIRFRRRTGAIDHGTSTRKRSNYYDIEVKRGVGASGDTEPVMEISVKDDGKPWGQPKKVGLGLTGDVETTVRVRMRGIYRKRQLEIMCSDNVEFHLKSIKENIELMAS